MAKTGKKLTLKEAVALLNEAHDIHPETDGRNAYSPKTIYNAVSSGRLKRFGPRHILQLDEVELLRVLGPKKVG